ncbi:MAG TPA: nucleotidyltransferase family protein, partial [Actinomycetota bacterium]|nr:nucleotidyltransferase family protein [Actinomycetota bacterium]
MGTDPQHDTSLRAAMLVLALDRATAQAAEALEASEIPTLLLKGPVTARWLYADGSTRPYSDVDLLVAPRDYSPAEETLRALGFRRMGLDTLPVNREGYAITLRRPNDGLAIDLHHSFVGIEADDEAMWSVFAADAEPIVVADTELRMPSEP